MKGRGLVLLNFVLGVFPRGKHISRQSIKIFLAGQLMENRALSWLWTEFLALISSHFIGMPHIVPLVPCEPSLDVVGIARHQVSVWVSPLRLFVRRGVRDRPAVANLADRVTSGNDKTGQEAHEPAREETRGWRQ
jgi:hypothetical protein